MGDVEETVDPGPWSEGNVVLGLILAMGQRGSVALEKRRRLMCLNRPLRDTMLLHYCGER